MNQKKSPDLVTEFKKQLSGDKARHCQRKDSAEQEETWREYVPSRKEAEVNLTSNHSETQEWSPAKTQTGVYLCKLISKEDEDNDDDFLIRKRH